MTPGTINSPTAACVPLTHPEKLHAIDARQDSTAPPNLKGLYWELDAALKCFLRPNAVLELPSMQSFEAVYAWELRKDYNISLASQGGYLHLLRIKH